MYFRNVLVFGRGKFLFRNCFAKCREALWFVCAAPEEGYGLRGIVFYL
jgi:hypothetical protein